MDSEGLRALHYSCKLHCRIVNLSISASPFPVNEFICLEKWQPFTDPLRSTTASKITVNELFGDCLSSSHDWLSASCQLNLFVNTLETLEGHLSLSVEYSRHFKMSSLYDFFFLFFFCHLCYQHCFFVASSARSWPGLLAEAIKPKSQGLSEGAEAT